MSTYPKRILCCASIHNAYSTFTQQFVPFSCLMPSFSLSSQNFSRGAMPSRHFFWGGGANAPLSPRFRRHWVKWTDRVTNAEVLRKMGLHELRLLRMIKESKQVYIEKKLKNDSLFALASKGKIIGKAPRGRRRKSMFDT